MPLFEFTCRHCGHQFETFVTATRQPLCPKCQSTELKKLFSTFATHGSTRTEGGGAAASRFT